MKHKRSFNRLDRKASHRRALHNNMVTALLRHGRIRTSKAKALEIRRTAEHMITRARVDSVHNRRMVARRIHDSAVLAKLFGSIAERFRTRPGGYTRLLKLGPRYGDASEMVLLELLQESEEAESPPPRGKAEAKRGEGAAAGGDAATDTNVAAADGPADGEPVDDKGGPPPPTDEATSASAGAKQEAK